MLFSKVSFLIITFSIIGCSHVKEFQVSQPDLGDGWPKYESDTSPRSVKLFKKGHANNLVKGICFIRTPKQTFEKVCQNIQLGVQNENGTIVEKVFTDNSGNFSFKKVTLGYHRLIVLTKGYKTVSKEFFITGGAEVLLNLIKE